MPQQFKKYSSAYTKTIMGGARVYRNNLKINSSDKIANGQLCHQLSDDCQELIKFSCDRCAVSWYEIISSNCKESYSKICGIDHCGTLDNPACPRGFFNTLTPSPNSKIDASFCLNGLSPVEDNGGIVICR